MLRPGVHGKVKVARALDITGEVDDSIGSLLPALAGGEIANV
jgi:hypothetical protein